MVSEGDLLRRVELGTEKRRGGWRAFFTGTATLAEEYVRSHGAVARDIMTREVISVDRDHPARRHRRPDGAEAHQARAGAGGRQAGRHRQPRRTCCAPSPRRPPDAGAGGAADDDAAIREALLAELGRQTWSRRAENTVVVSDGVVHLWGLVATPEELRALELAAQAIPGVKAVRNHMIVLSEEPYPLFPGSFAA